MLGGELANRNGVHAGLGRAEVGQHDDGRVVREHPAQAVAHLVEHRGHVDLGDDGGQVQRQRVGEIPPVEHLESPRQRVQPHRGQHQLEERFAGHHLHGDAGGGGPRLHQGHGGLPHQRAPRDRQHHRRSFGGCGRHPVGERRVDRFEGGGFLVEVVGALHGSPRRQLLRRRVPQGAHDHLSRPVE